MIRKAQIGEIPEIHRLLGEFSQVGEVLPRTRASLYSQMRDYSVYREDQGPIIGIAALHVAWEGLAEIRSLVVVPSHQKRGIGSRLVENCLAEASHLGVQQIFVLTAIPEFFRRFGFRDYPRENLPLVVWADCVDCVKFPGCDEIPMILDLPAPIPPRDRLTP